MGQAVSQYCSCTINVYIALIWVSSCLHQVASSSQGPMWVQYLAQGQCSEGVVLWHPPILPEHIPCFVCIGARTNTFPGTNQDRPLKQRGIPQYDNSWSEKIGTRVYFKVRTYKFVLVTLWIRGTAIKTKVERGQHRGGGVISGRDKNPAEIILHRSFASWLCDDTSLFAIY